MVPGNLPSQLEILSTYIFVTHASKPDYKACCIAQHVLCRLTLAVLPYACKVLKFPCRYAHRFCGMYQGRLRCRQTSTAAVASFSDVLHLPETMGTVLRELSAPDLLRFASTSRACRAAASLSYVQLDLNSEAGLKAFRGLHRLGCLQQLQEADLTAVVSDAKAIGHLALLGTCSCLKKLCLGFEFDPNKLWWWEPYITIWTGVHAQADRLRQSAWLSLLPTCQLMWSAKL